MPQTLEKQPSEELLFDMDFSPHMREDETIIQALSIEDDSDDGDLTFGDAVVSGQVVQFTVAGGTDGELYKITVKIEGSSSPLIEGDGYLYIREL